MTKFIIATLAYSMIALNIFIIGLIIPCMMWFGAFPENDKCGDMECAMGIRVPAAYPHGQVCTPNMVVRKDILFVYAGPYVCSSASDVQFFMRSASTTTMRLYVDPTGY